jgi:hypothetical protein
LAAEVAKVRLAATEERTRVAANMVSLGKGREKAFGAGSPNQTNRRTFYFFLFFVAQQYHPGKLARDLFLG